MDNDPLKGQVRMIEIEIPGRGRWELEHLVLDVNGTIAAGGELIEGVAERLDRLAERVAIHLATADTHGRQAELDARLGLQATRVTRGQERTQKGGLVRELGAERVCYIGNGANDVEGLRAAAIGIAVVGKEGVAGSAIQAADLLAPSITAALDLLLHPTRLVATLRM